MVNAYSRGDTSAWKLPHNSMTSGSTARYTSTAAPSAGMSSAGSAGSVGSVRRARDALIVARVGLPAHPRGKRLSAALSPSRGETARRVSSCRKVADESGTRQPFTTPRGPKAWRGRAAAGPAPVRPRGVRRGRTEGCVVAEQEMRISLVVGRQSDVRNVCDRLRRLATLWRAVRREYITRTEVAREYPDCFSLKRPRGSSPPLANPRPRGADCVHHATFVTYRAASTLTLGRRGARSDHEPGDDTCTLRLRWHRPARRSLPCPSTRTPGMRSRAWHHAARRGAAVRAAGHGQDGARPGHRRTARLGLRRRRPVHRRARRGAAAPSVRPPVPARGSGDLLRRVRASRPESREPDDAGRAAHRGAVAGAARAPRERQAAGRLRDELRAPPRSGAPAPRPLRPRAADRATRRGRPSRAPARPAGAAPLRRDRRGGGGRARRRPDARRPRRRLPAGRAGRVRARGGHGPREPRRDGRPDPRAQSLSAHREPRRHRRLPRGRGALRSRLISTPAVRFALPLGEGGGRTVPVTPALRRRAGGEVRPSPSPPGRGPG